MNIVIIGAGPCGIMAALTIKKNHPEMKVTLLDKEKDIGSRIKISGNGKCNLGNINIQPYHYNHPEAAEHVLSYKEELFSLLNESGLYYFHDEEGRIYPRSESSSTVIHCLNGLLKKYRVSVVTKTKVLEVRKENGHFSVLTDTQNYSADKVVLAIGGISYNNERLNYNQLIKPFGAEIIPQNPSLTPLSTSSFDKEMEGKRVKGTIALLCRGKEVKKETGEILFKKDGVSGIAVFNLSSVIARNHQTPVTDYSLRINMFPELTKEELQKLAEKDPSMENILLPEIAHYVTRTKADPQNLVLSVRGLYEFKNSQVTSGGIALSELKEDFSLKSDENVYFGGEETDMDGECGGFNIEYAFLNGIAIGKNIR